MASLLSEAHLASLPKQVEMDHRRFLDDSDTEATRASTRERIMETPRRKLSQSEEPGTPASGGRRSARAKVPPEGFFRQHVRKRLFGSTMWGGFLEG